MDNLEFEVQGNTLHLLIDLTQSSGLTKSGRNILIASSRGNVPVWVDGAPHPDNIKLSVSVFRSLTEDEKQPPEPHVERPPL